MRQLIEQLLSTFSLNPLSSPFFRVKWLYDFGFWVGLTQKIR